MENEVRFAEVRKLLENAGWTLKRIAGSHHVFTKPGCRPYPVPVHRGKVAGVYVKEIKKIVAHGSN
jgi:predicted RNA binding protein YcfA (HicA-like mRNA interferase family)